ncbi:MAG: ComF family protein, partial [Bacteroidota bacterium]|nr:ComF family protein [Bacteroidota bacterium]MDX5431671.1 ComF family protein [Bacteroidota bacterium]MDX5470387.1 ComF family protein [Bacteroidota bacterium]
PVPLHPQKEKQRGYNQALQLAIGFSHQSAIPLIKNAVVKQLHSGSQTRLSRFARWQNAEAGYEAGDLEKVRGKHVLLIDDVVTTGATLEACARVLIEQGNCRVSVLTAACAIQ